MRVWRLVLMLGMLAIAVAATGCDSASPGPDKRRGVEESVTLTPVTYAEFDRVVRSKKGSVVLVDIWATWCPACVQGFPHVVEWHNRYSDLVLECISLSVDGQNGRGSREDALRFLKAKKATFTNFLWQSSTEKEESEFGPRYLFGNALPHQVVFGRDGQLVWASTQGRMTPDGVDRLIRDELEKK